jgi:hypothetical protein
MRRRTLLAAGAAAGAALLAGCARPGTPQPGSATSGGGSGAGDGRPVASWRVFGGFLPPEGVAMEVPKLVVYATGLAVADVAYQAELTPAEVSDLVAALASRLRDATAAGKRGNLGVADAPSTELLVRADKPYSLTVEALDEVRGDGIYPDALYQARDRLDQMYRNVVAGKRAYTSPRVRVVAVPVEGGTDTTAPVWPADVPEPGTQREGFLTSDLTGSQAVAAVARLPVRPAAGSWPVYRSRVDGRLLRAAARYLLPHE